MEFPNTAFPLNQKPNRPSRPHRHLRHQQSKSSHPHPLFFQPPPLTCFLVSRTPPPRKLWADLVKTSQPTTPAKTTPLPASSPSTPSLSSPPTPASTSPGSSPASAAPETRSPSQPSTDFQRISRKKKKSLVETVRNFQISFEPAFIQPRGMVNQGNMCFMHVILQPLLFSDPLFHLLHQIDHLSLTSKKTPVLENM